MKKFFTFLLLFAIAVSACNFAMPGGQPTTTEMLTRAPERTRTRTPKMGASPTRPASTATPLSLMPSPTLETDPPTPTSIIFPRLTFAADTVCRAGPGVRYYARTRITKGQSFEASGRNADSSWLMVQATRLGDDCWVQASTLDEAGDFSALRVIETQSLPDQPLGFVASANACGGVNHLWLYWADGNGIGYRIYRNGKEIATVYGTQYRDLNTPRSKLPEVYRYEIEAFNSLGASERSGLSVTICG